MSVPAQAGVSAQRLHRRERGYRHEYGKEQEIEGRNEEGGGVRDAVRYGDGLVHGPRA